jgi:hypothetical protein
MLVNTKEAQLFRQMERRFQRQTTAWPIKHPLAAAEKSQLFEALVRDHAAIKNQLTGPETEAFELYPAESRLLDPSNYYILWCFPGLHRIKVGQPHRFVRDAHEALAPQRGLAKQLNRKED